MGQGGGVSCMKYILFVCNLLFALTGVLILFVGVVVQLKYYHYSNFVGESIWTAPIVLIIVGIFVFIIGFLGCCGAIKENSCMILTFSVLITVIFLSEIGVGIAGYVKHRELPDILEKHFNTSLKNYNREDYKDGWNVIQTELDCCGIHNYTDWTVIYPNGTLPVSCCREILETSVNQDKECRAQYNDLMDFRRQGCLEKLLSILDSKALFLGGVVLSVALIQILTILFACCLYRLFRRNYQTV